MPINTDMAGFATPGVLNPIDPNTGYSRNYPGMSLILPFMEKPNSQDFSWLNQGSAVATDYADRMTITAPDSSATQCRTMTRLLPATPYTVTMCGSMLCTGTSTSGSMFGIVLGSSGNALRDLCVIQGPTSVTQRLRIDSWTSATSFSAVVQDTVTTPISPTFIGFRITDDGANRVWKASVNGKTWVTVRSESTNTGVTPTHAGVLVYNNNGASAAAISSARFDVYHLQIVNAILGDAP